MDAFKINWNQKMKTDMFVNKILNGDTKNDYVVWHEYDAPSRRRKYYGFNMDDASFIAAHKIYENLKYPKPTDAADFTYYDTSKLLDNTRPQSLYNLRYASLR